jgi:hypothetical protein
MYKPYTNLLLLFCVFLLLTFGGGCKRTIKNENENTQIEQIVLPETFTAFYERFHTDSLYQLEHILFPLSSKVYENQDKYYEQFWTHENWKMHYAFTETNDSYQQEYRISDDRLITEIIYLKMGGFGLERRFAFIDTTWYLILYNEYHSDTSNNAIESDEK